MWDAVTVAAGWAGEVIAWWVGWANVCGTRQIYQGAPHSSVPMPWGHLIAAVLQTEAFPCSQAVGSSWQGSSPPCAGCDSFWESLASKACLTWIIKIPAVLLNSSEPALELREWAMAAVFGGGLRKAEGGGLVSSGKLGAWCSFWQGEGWCWQLP